MLSGRSETKRAKNHVLKFEEIPEHLRNAIIAAEDQRFFEHHGLDPRGIGRALVTNVTGGEIKQGGSTITQQLVKNTFLTPERSFTRKFAEAFLSVLREQKAAFGWPRRGSAGNLCGRGRGLRGRRAA
jgi:membrane peptidoglycan carboxypeptidase